MKQRELYMPNHIRLMFDATPTAISLYDKDLELFDCNLEAARMFGFTSKEAYIATFKERLHAFFPEKQPCGIPSGEKLTRLLERVETSGTVSSEWIYLTRENVELPAKITMSRVPFGDTHWTVVYAQNLTEIMASHEKELEAGSRLRQIYDASPIPSSLWSFELKPIDCNNAMVDLLGMDGKNDFIERFVEFNPVMQSGGVSTAEKIKKVIDMVAEKGIYHYDWLFLDSDGEEIPGSCVAVRVDLKNTSFLSVHFQDLRPFLESQKRERQAYERTQLMLDAAPLIIQYWNENGEAIDCNKTTLTFYGFDTKEQYFSNFKDKLAAHQPCGTPSWDKWLKFLDEVFEKGLGFLEFTEIDIYGKSALFEVLAISTIYNEIPVIITYSTDITKINEAREEKKLIEVAEESNKAKNRFLARMSHEIRTPITAILGISEVSLRNPSIDAETEESFAKILNSSSSLLRIINDILDLSRIEANKMTLLNEEYQIGSVIGNTLSLTLAYMKDGITFNMHVDENLPEFLVGDAIRIEQIMNNVLSNAFKYTVEGAVDFHIRCGYISPDFDDCVLEIIIKDTGLGMTDAQVSAIYQDYARFHEDYRHISGTGLGSSIVMNLVKLMSAEIELDSKKGEGTTVTIRIPQLISGTKRLGKETAERLQKFDTAAMNRVKKLDSKVEPMPYGKVLVVDDVDANLYVATGMLRFYDLNIEICSSGWEAIDKIKTGKVYDLIFMDNMMPGINGTDTMRYIRNLGYNHPIVVFTADAMIGKATEFISAGFDGFISKPIQISHLNSILMKHVRDKQSHEVITQARQGKSDATLDEVRNAQDGSDIQKMLKREFVTSQKNTFADICDALERDDQKTAHRLAHTLKGLAKMIHEPTLAKTAAHLEEFIDEEKAPSADIMSLLEAQLSSVISGISNAAAGTSTEQSKALLELEKMIPLLTHQKADCLSMVGAFAKIPEAAIFVRQIKKFDFQGALKSADVLRVILEEV